MYNYICTSRYVYIFILRWCRKKGAHDEKKERAEKFKQRDWIKDKEEEKISGEDGKNVSPKWLFAVLREFLQPTDCQAAL